MSSTKPHRRLALTRPTDDVEGPEREAGSELSRLQERLARMERRLEELEEIVLKLAGDQLDPHDAGDESDAHAGAVDPVESEEPASDKLRTGEGNLAAYSRDGRKAVAVCAEGKRGPVHVYDEQGNPLEGGQLPVVSGQ